MTRVGWGIRHPDLTALLRGGHMMADENATWGDAIRIRRAAYLGEAELPDEIVVSVRCIVSVDDALVVCTNIDGISHPWPGGRREPGESFAETARREVHEETGWLVDTSSLRQLGWLHIENLEPVPPDFPYPHPDALHVVFCCRAEGRDGDESWTDTEGYETESCLMSLDDAYVTVDHALSRVFLDLLRTEIHERL